MRLILTLAAIVFSLPAGAETPKVVTDIPAVHSLTAQVMGDLGDPLLLLQGGSDPHHFQLKPSQALALSRADLVIWIGPSLTPWLDRAVKATGGQDHSLTLLDAPGTRTLAFKKDHEDHHDEDHDDDHDEHEGDHDGDHAKEDAHGHDHGDTDPHAWLAPDNARQWVTLIAAKLSEQDPENAGTYVANAASAVLNINAAEAQAEALLAPAHGQPIVVFHDAYGYFASHFDLTVHGSIAEGDAAAPGAAHMSELRALLHNNGTICIFPEVHQNTAYLDTVIEGTKARIGAPLDPSGINLTPGAGLYGALLVGLAETISDCTTAQN